MRNRPHLSVSLIALTTSLVIGPLTEPLAGQVTAADYARAERFLGWNAERLISGTEVSPHWLERDRFWYRNRIGDGHEFILVDARARSRNAAFDHARLAAELSVAADTSYEPLKLPFDEFKFTGGGRSIRFAVDDSIAWICDINAYRCSRRDSADDDPVTEVKSPDGRWAAFERDENLWVRDLESGDEIQLSQDGEKDYGYAVNPEGCCTVITDRRRGREKRPILAWSPDSKRIATHRLDERGVQQFHILETVTGRPVLHSYRYALPGDSVIPMFDLYIFDVEARKAVRLGVDRQDMTFGRVARDSIWTTARWGADSDQLFFTWGQRDNKLVKLMVGDASNGEVRTIIEERSTTFVSLNVTSRSIPNWRVINGDREVIWFSERDGWGHLYLYDATTGSLENQITSGPWVVVNVLHVDEPGRWVYFTAVGKEADRDWYLRQLYRAKLDGSTIELLALEDADHDVRAAPSGAFFVDTYSKRAQAPVTVLRGPDGREMQIIEDADISRLLEAGWQPPEHFIAKGRDGSTDIHGYLYTPSNFDADRSYPIIDYIYPGPQVGPIGWRSFRPNTPGNPQALAELGFFVVTLDAMGTPLRSKAFHDRWYGDMRDNGLEDHVATIEELAARHPQIDLNRVGIYGHSGGGFSSTDAILRFPDFFKVAVSAAGNHDNRSYFYSWGEKYQGPLKRGEDGTDSFESQANQAMAENLRGKLMLVYGTLDDNVHPNATLLVIDELIKHNKDFDLLVLPNRNHSYSREPYMVRRTWDYFVKHLLETEPPKEYQIEEAI